MDAENGLGDSADKKRQEFLVEFVYHTRRLMRRQEKSFPEPALEAEIRENFKAIYMFLSGL